MALDLRQFESLRNLGVDMSGYPRKERLIPHLVQTAASLTKLERIFINCGPSVTKPDKQIDGHLPIWEALDSHLSQLPSLKHVTFIIVLDSCLGVFLNPAFQGGVGNVIAKFKDELLQYVGAKVPSCREKGLVDVAEVVGSSTSNPFADLVLPN